METLRERFEKLQRWSCVEGSLGGPSMDYDDRAGEYLSRDDVLALVSEVERERDAKINELQRAYLSTRGAGTTSAEWARLYDAIHALTNMAPSCDLPYIPEERLLGTFALKPRG